MGGTSGSNRYPVPFLALGPFLLITFGLAWGIFALFILIFQLNNPLWPDAQPYDTLFFVAAIAVANVVRTFPVLE